MKTSVLCTSIACLLSAAANGAGINWQTPLTISGTSDISLNGTLVGTWAPGDDWGYPNYADLDPVNGVTFNAYGSGPFNSFVSQSGLDDRYGSFVANTADSNYNFLMASAIYSSGEPISLTWGGMTPGNTYELEFWVNDGRNAITAERSETLTGGGNTSAALTYGTGGSGPGQYILGTFVADASGQQTITLNAFGGADISASAQINLLQLRDLTPAPEPASISLFGVGACMMLYAFRRKSRAI